MGAPKHSPAPWVWGSPDYEAEHEPPESCASSYLQSGTTGFETVLSGCGSCGNIFYSEADGHLIAAAPDLLAACEAVATSSMRNEAYDLCVAAIAKARGQ